MSTIIACSKCMAVPAHDDSNVGAGCACGGTFTYAQITPPLKGFVGRFNVVHAIFADGVRSSINLTREQYEAAQKRIQRMERVETRRLKGAALTYACTLPNADQPKTFGCNHTAPTCHSCEAMVYRWLIAELGDSVYVPEGYSQLPWEHFFPPATPVPEKSADLGLTNQEKFILQKTAELYNLLATLPGKHSSDMEENRRDIHNIQNRIMARVAARSNPELVR